MEVIINGHKLTTSQVMTLKTALNIFLMDLRDGALGDDSDGINVTNAFLDRAKEIQVLLYG